MLTIAAANQMLDSLDETPAAPSAGYAFSSLHSAYSATGTNELTGGSPAYARKAATGAAATGRSKTFTNASAFDVPAGATVAWVGRWTLVTGGVFLGMGPAGGGARRQFGVTAAGVTANTIDSPAHGFTAGQAVVLWAAAGAGLPTPFAEGTIYYVIATGLTANVLSVSATLGGSAVTITAVGDGELQLITSEVFAGQGQYNMTGDILSLPA